MYDHHKGPEKAPRHDPYLCGKSPRISHAPKTRNATYATKCLGCMEFLHRAFGDTAALDCAVVITNGRLFSEVLLLSRVLIDMQKELPLRAMYND